MHDDDDIIEDYDTNKSKCERIFSRRNLFIFTLFALFVVLVVLVVTLTRKKVYLENDVTVTKIFDHLNKFYDISKDYSYSRSIKYGFTASAQYVMDTIKNQSDCNLWTQNFDAVSWRQNKVPTFQLNTPYSISYQYNYDFTALRYGGNGTFDIVNANLKLVDNDGCNVSDFSKLNAGDVALVLYTTNCTILSIALNAENVSASALIFYNSPSRTALLGARVRNDGWVPGDPLANLPVFSMTSSSGSLLASLPDAVVEIHADTTIFVTNTFNIFCESQEGNVSNTIIVGAHLDSVEQGPGINDNASGSATILEILLAMYRVKFKPTNKLIFAWWGAEEEGLLGSRHYVNHLQTENATQFQNTAMALNFDMVASPNYIFMVYNGSTIPSNNPSRKGSENLQPLFENYVNKTKGANVTGTPMTGGSDFYPFVLAGIPASGMAAGAGSSKSANDVISYGGIADTPLDSCYHRACDTPFNINKVCLDVISDAAAHVIQCISSMSHLREFLNGENNVTANC